MGLENNKKFKEFKGCLAAENFEVYYRYQLKWCDRDMYFMDIVRVNDKGVWMKGVSCFVVDYAEDGFEIFFASTSADMQDDVETLKSLTK